MVSGNDRKLRKKNKKLNKKEAKLLAILADYLPDLDELLQNDSMLTISNTLLAVDIPQQLDLVTAAVVESSGDNTPGSTETAVGTSSSEIDSVPEPSMFALLGLGFAGLMFSGRRRRLLSMQHDGACLLSLRLRPVLCTKNSFESTVANISCH